MNRSLLSMEVKLTYNWYKKLTGRFLNIASIQTTIIVITTLFSQIFMLLAMMMPLKVVMLLGSDNIPRFFPNSWQSLDRDMLIIYLAIASVGFFLLHLLCEKIINIYSINGSNKILKNNKKVVLFENQNDFAKKSYTKLAKSLSNMIFFILSLIGLGIVYSHLFFVIIFFTLSIYIMFSIVFYNNKSAKILNEEFNNSLDLLKGICFFVVFAFILWSFLTDFYPPQTIVVILSILLVRQMFSKLSSAIKDIKSLYKDRLKINSLFFFRDTKVQIQHDKKDPFWSLLKHETREKWIKELLDNVFENDIAYISSQWHKVNIKNIAFFKVIVKDNDSNITHTYLIKLFNKNISSQAVHEATILQENIHDFLNLPYIGSSLVKEFHCNVFEYFNVEPVQNFKQEHILFRIKMMSIEPPKELLERYSRSHPYLHSRLSKKMLDKLYLTADEDETGIIKDFEESFDDIIQKIKAVPLQIINPLITKFSLVTFEDKFALLHWGGWKIDSLGTDFPIAIKAMDTLKENFDIANEKIDDIVLVSLMSQFEKLYNGENFTGIIEIMPRILECIEDEK